MSPIRVRQRIRSPDLSSVAGLDPTAGVKSISGVRIHDVGQGDSLSVLDERGKPFFQIDYGGRVGTPHHTAFQVDHAMPVDSTRLLMLSHWDEDHWCAAVKGTDARASGWLVPRQLTSPRAVRFSLTLSWIHCVPESEVGVPHRFSTSDGDEIWWEKIAPAPAPGAATEDCNHTGIAFSLLKVGRAGAPDRVLLLPGDAPFDRVSHYWEHLRLRRMLVGVVAFHHGTQNHWTARTNQLLRKWPIRAPTVDVVFSCAQNNSYGHPHTANYARLPYPTQLVTTPALRLQGIARHDLRL